MSAFYRYFRDLFQFLGIKKLIATGFNEGGQGFKAVIEGGVETKSLLEGNGDFRSAECVELLKECDIVITNPPFSLFREFIVLLMEHGKQFLVIGNMNAITYKEVFKHIQADALWLGMSPRSMTFITPEGEVDVNACWFTNLTHKKRQSDLILFRSIKDLDYPKYDNYDAIEVSRVCNIPIDYDGVMGVPITFLEHYNPLQFEILGMDDHRVVWRGRGPDLCGKSVYRRIIIRKRQGGVQ